MAPSNGPAEEPRRDGPFVQAFFQECEEQFLLAQIGMGAIKHDALHVLRKQSTGELL
jgi:hypothetical protein